MRATRVVLTAPVASFRHPFFVTGHQPSFDVPPPSTIHGLTAAAMGAWPAQNEFWFGLHFTYRAKSRDLEHQHITTALSPRTPTFVDSEKKVRATTEIVVQPVTREFLFGTTLTLYLPRELEAAFRSPVFALTLGRSQDLAEIISIDEIDLVFPTRARIEHTYLPRRLRPCVRFGPTVLLSRHISAPPRRDAVFAQYIVLHEPVFFGGDAGWARSFDRVDGMDLSDLYCDADHTDDDGFARAVWIHHITESSDS